MNNLMEAIKQLKKEKNAIILGHYYQKGEIQDIADYVGDSLALAQWAAKTEADIIVMCGVHFMGETAKVLCPDKKVLVPDMAAGCSLADSCPADKFAQFVKEHVQFFLLFLPGICFHQRQQLRQRRKALLPGHGGTGAALLLVGPVQILHLRQRGGVFDGGGQLVGELALPIDGGQHLLPALGQITQVAQAILQLPQGGVVHRAVEFLAVAGNEGDGVALVQKGDDVFHVAQGLVQLPGQQLGDSRHRDGSPFRKL